MNNSNKFFVTFESLCNYTGLVELTPEKVEELKHLKRNAVEMFDSDEAIRIKAIGEATSRFRNQHGKFGKNFNLSKLNWKELHILLEITPIELDFHKELTSLIDEKSRRYQERKKARAVKRREKRKQKRLNKQPDYNLGDILEKSKEPAPFDSDKK
jgi:hypothetical protein